MKPKHLVTGLLCIQALLLGWGAMRHSPTYDEVAHLPAGLSHWELGDYRLFRVNPPLVRMVAALPVWLIGAETDWTRLHAVIASNSKQRVDFDVGRDFITANGERAFWLYTFARWACIPFVSLGGWVIWRWSSRLYGERSGLIGVVIWTFSPMVLGHGQLITPDVAAGSLGALVFYLFWRWVNEPLWAMAYGVGLSLGLTALTKSTWIIAPGLMMMLWIASIVMQRRLKLEWIGQAAFLLAVAWLVFVIGYTGDGLFKPLGEYRFQSQAFRGDPQQSVNVGEESKAVPGVNRFAESFLGRLPVPLPEQFILGVDVQKSNFESTTLSYLRGELRRGGWWYYYLYGVVVKSTVGVLVLLVGVTILRLIGYRRLSLRESGADPLLSRSERRRWLDECFVLVPMLAVLFMVSSQTGINKHLRYLLPAYPFAIIWISQIGHLIELSSGRFRHWASVLTTGLLASSILSSLWIYPHSMSYFNEIAGGPRRGDDHLINSNVDWGQDLFFLKDKMKQHGWDRVGMVYWGRYDARLAGVDFDLPPNLSIADLSGQSEQAPVVPSPGIYAISINQLRGYRFVAPNGEGGLQQGLPDGYQYFQRWKPIGTVGYSMRLFEISEEDIRLLEEELGLGGG